MNADTRQVITPDHDAHWHALRASDLTSTDSAALFGLSPYKTHFELWHEKHSLDVVEFHEDARIKWGRRLEGSVALGIAEDQGLVVQPMKQYIRLEGLRIGSSFDFEIIGATDDSPWAAHFATMGRGILEIKCVDWLAFQDGWTIEDGFIEAPAHIEVQTQHQQLVAGRGWSLIGAMVGGNDIRILERMADAQTHKAIRQAARAFWASIDANMPPPPVMPDDADAVIRMNAYAAPGKLFDARKDEDVNALVRRYHRIAKLAGRLDEAKKVAKAEILERIGDAEKVLLDGFSVSAGMVGPCEVAYTREGYRNFRVTAKKAGKA